LAVPEVAALKVHQAEADAIVTAAAARAATADYLATAALLLPNLEQHGLELSLLSHNYLPCVPGSLKLQLSSP